MFWTVFAFCFPFIGLFFGMVAYFNTESYTHPFVRFLIALLVACLATGFAAGLFTLDYMGNTMEWNEGFCPTCNLEWEFANASRSHGSTHYYYHCTGCGDIIDLTQNPNGL